MRSKLNQHERTVLALIDNLAEKRSYVAERIARKRIKWVLGSTVVMIVFVIWVLLTRSAYSMICMFASSFGYIWSMVATDHEVLRELSEAEIVEEGDQ